MKFTIIITTYNRPAQIQRAIQSIIDQTYTNWQIIIINDSPDCDYTKVENNIQALNTKNLKIKYFKNQTNKGKNQSCNFALLNIQKDADYIIFLDDDDWLSQDALESIKSFLEQNKKGQHMINWLVTNRYDIINKKSLTTNITNTNKINYLKDYLILKKFKGDATHIISTKIKNFDKLKFSKIKNAEEWIFFAQIQSHFIYFDHNSTLSEGYESTGITNNYKNKKQKLKNTLTLLFECKQYKIIDTNPLNIQNYLIIIYFILRICAIILKK